MIWDVMVTGFGCRFWVAVSWISLVLGVLQQLRGYRWRLLLLKVPGHEINTYVNRRGWEVHLRHGTVLHRCSVG